MKLYKKIDAYVKGGKLASMPCPVDWYYFTSSNQFKTCEDFKRSLNEKYSGLEFFVGWAE